MADSVQLTIHIEVNTLIKPRIPLGSESSSEDDPTGVRALLSSLPEPDPMPAHLVERISASLAAEQAQRAARTSSTSVSPLRAGVRRPARLMVAIGGAAAALILVAVLSENMFRQHHSSAISGSAAISSTSRDSQAAGGGQPNTAAKAPALAGRTATASRVQIGQSEIRYTQADFVKQVRALHRNPFQPTAGQLPGVGAIGTGVGLKGCLSAIGASAAQVVRADLAFYDGQPAVIIVSTTNGISTAYAVGRRCSQTNAAILRAATPVS